MHSLEASAEFNPTVHTDGGSYVGGNVDTRGGSFTGRDLIIHGDVHVHQPPRPLPSRSSTPPQISTKLVGRTIELAHYTECLQKEGSAIMTGMAGVGKTLLAQRLVELYPEPQQVFCYTFFEGRGLRGLIERLGEFLAWHEQPTVWQLYSNSSQPLTDEALVSHLISDLAKGTYLIWLDDFHLIEHYPVAAYFAQQLLNLTTNRRLQLLITTRHTPDFLQVEATNVLSGLTFTDTQQLLTESQLTLSVDIVNALHHYTEGNAQLLILAAQVLKQAKQPERLVARLATTGAIERYLLKQVDRYLQPEEKEVMKALAVLLGYPVPRVAVEAILDNEDLRDLLSSLSERLFIVVSYQEDERCYHQHSIVREFYYVGLNSAKRRSFHQRAAVYFTTIEDFVTAARHWHKAGEASRAAQLLYDHLPTLLNRGQAQALYDLQAQFSKTEFDENAWTMVKIVAGRAATFVADTTTALATFAEATCCHDPYLQAQALYYRAQLLAKIHLDDALAQAQQGIGLLQPRMSMAQFTELLSDFYLLVAFFYLVERPDLVQAEAYLTQAQALLSATDFSRQCDLHNALSSLCSARGDPQGELYHSQHAYHAATQTQANDLLIVAAHNLGQSYTWAGEYTVAFDYLQQAKRQAVTVGNREWQAKCDQVMGASYFFQAHYAQAIMHYQTAYSIFQQIGNQRALAWICHDLAEVHSQVNNFTLARQYFIEATTLNQQLTVKKITMALTELTRQYPVLLDME